jgi:uncharacterized membrane protein
MDRRIERDQTEFGRTLSFFDAIFAVSMTLLVTTLSPAPDDWSSWSALWDGVGYQHVAFVISFVLIGAYWWGNHRFVGSLETLSPGLVIVTVAMLGFVALVPFTTDALGDEGRSTVEVATVVYAANLALLSILATVLHVIARRDRLYRNPPTPAEARMTFLDQSVTTAVFLVSIPVAVVVSGAAGRWCWMSLVVIGPLSARWTGRQARRDHRAVGVLDEG